MGLFGRLFGGGDPSAKWVRDPGLALEVDLNAAALCGVRLGLRPDSLAKLGAPSNPDATLEGLFSWAPLGLQATAVKGVLTSYTLAFNLKDEGLAPFAGAILLDGKRVDLTRDSRAEDITRLLGEPWHRYADPEDADSELGWFYELRGLEWEVEILSNGLLGSIAIHSPPSLARPEARRLLRVEKPWPP